MGHKHDFAHSLFSICENNSFFFISFSSFDKNSREQKVRFEST